MPAVGGFWSSAFWDADVWGSDFWASGEPIQTEWVLAGPITDVGPLATLADVSPTIEIHELSLVESS